MPVIVRQYVTYRPGLGVDAGELGLDYGWPDQYAGLRKQKVNVSDNGQCWFVQYGPVFFGALQLFNAPRTCGGCGDRLSLICCYHPRLDDTIGHSLLRRAGAFFTGSCLYFANPSDTAPAAYQKANNWSTREVTQRRQFCPLIARIICISATSISMVSTKPQVLPISKYRRDISLYNKFFTIKTFVFHSGYSVTGPN